MYKHTLDQNKAAVNLADTYRIWMRAEQATYAARLRWKTVDGKDYLCRIRRGTSHATSLGPRSEATEAQYQIARDLEELAKNSGKRLLMLGKAYRTFGLPTVASFAVEALRQLDRHRLLDGPLRVVGTHALAAYELEAGHSLDDSLHATNDFDLTWVGEGAPAPDSLLEILREVNPRWTVNTERSFQILDEQAQVIDLLVAPSLMKTLPRGPWRAVDVEGQEDLLGGMPVDQVVTDARGTPARVVAPDPRLFALHKWLLAQEPERKANKRTKDHVQAVQVRQLIEKALPAYAFDEEFLEDLSPRLKQAWSQWQATLSPPTPQPSVGILGPRRPRPR